MFQRRRPGPNAFGTVKYPTQINEKLRLKRWEAAAEDMMSDKSIPFNMAFIFLSHSPNALACYLRLNIPELEDAEPFEMKEEEEKKEKIGDEEEDGPVQEISPEDEEKQRLAAEAARKRSLFSARSCMFINLYLAVAVPLLGMKTGSEKRETREYLIDFCKRCKPAIEKKQLYKMAAEISDDDFSKSVHLLFGDIWDYCMIMLEKGDRDRLNERGDANYDRVVSQLGKLSEEQLGQVYKRLPLDYLIRICPELYTGKVMPKGHAFYPFLVETVFLLGDDNSFSQAAVACIPIIERMYKAGALETPAHRQIYYHMVSRIGDVTLLPTIYADAYFRDIGYDYVLRILERQLKYEWAAQFCAYVDDRHAMAVSYGVKGTIKAITVMLLEALADAEDNKDCWVRALKRLWIEVKNDVVEDREWRELLERSTGSGVISMDDIFDLMPEDMSIDQFQSTILQSLTRYKNSAIKADEKIKKLTERSATQRMMIQTGPKMKLELDALQSCEFCQELVYTDKFIAFPCRHAIHVRCFLDHMHQYFPAIKQLDLISLSSRAMRDEKSAAGLANVICQSCPICGERALGILEKPFVTLDDQEEASRWTLPDIQVKLPAPRKRKLH